MGSKMGAADPNYPKIQGLSRLSRLSYGIAASPQRARTALEATLRQGAQVLLQAAIEQRSLRLHSESINISVMTRVIAKSFATAIFLQRQLQTGIGNVSVRQPRINDHRSGHLQRAPSSRLTSSTSRFAGQPHPGTRLRGISTSEMSRALEPILGENASGLSAANVVRTLKEQWEKDHASNGASVTSATRNTSISGPTGSYRLKPFVRLNDRPPGGRMCFLVIVG